jgi:hypothetical protein
MKQEFMSAAKRVGKFLSIPVLAFMMVACGGEATASSNGDHVTTSAKVSVSQDAKKDLPFPLLPASIAESTYNGQKGCIPSDKNYLLAVTENEGHVTLGVLNLIQTPKSGAHSLIVTYNAEKDYGYTLTNIGDGMLCSSEKLTNFRIQPLLQAPTVSNPAPFTAQDCSFTRRYTEMCGTFNKLAGGLQRTGFEINWSADKTNGDTLTLLSGKGKSYYLTTNKDTGATVITGSGKYEFKFINIPTVNSAPLIALN